MTNYHNNDFVLLCHIENVNDFALMTFICFWWQSSVNVTTLVAFPLNCCVVCVAPEGRGLEWNKCRATVR